MASSRPLAYLSGGGSIAGKAICRQQFSICNMLFCLMFLSVIIPEAGSSPVLPVQPSTVESWTGWGNCSRSCGGGVAERRRICHNNSDTLEHDMHKCKETVQYKLCNYQNCPVGKEDVRWHQLCARYNNIYYHWRPYKPNVEVVNPCALRCYAVENTEHVVQLPDMPNGKLCSNAARAIERGVCLRGECVKVGCDNILNSDKEIDVCGICGGNSRACEAVEGEFQTSNLKVGYNDVVEIPTGAKNIQIIEKRGKNYLALRNEVGDYFLNGNWLIERPGQIQVAGTLVNYRRPQLWVMGQLQGEWETITAPGPTNTSICVMVLCTDTSTHIAYKFTLPTVSEDGTLHVDSFIGGDISTETHTHSLSTNVAQETNVPAVHTTIQPDDRTADMRVDGLMTTLFDKSVRSGARVPVGGEHVSSAPRDSAVGPRKSAFRPRGDTDDRPAVVVTERTAAPDIERESPKVIHKTVREDEFDFRDKIDIPTDTSVGNTEHNGTTLNVDIVDAQNQEMTEVGLTDIETGTPSQDESSVDVFHLGYVLIPPQESGSEEMLSQWIVRVFPASVDDVYEADGTIVEDFHGPTQIYENNSTEVMNVNPNGARRNWGNEHDPYYGNNGGIQSTYTWTTSGSTECSATCTRGVTTTSPYCQRQDGERVSDHYCDISMKPNVGFNECHAQTCEARWEVGKWSGCSESCDEGHITRLVNCWRMIKPGLDSSVDSRQCSYAAKPNSSEPCEIIPCTPTWRSSEWRSCNVSCGEGHETREVQCVGPAHLSCDQTTKPSAEKRCTAGVCKYRWHSSEWTPCPGICGVQTRTLECKSSNGTRAASELCRELEQLYETQLCGAKTCTRRWIPQQWSHCSVKCGQGTRTRAVICASIEFNKMRIYPDTGYCQGRKPITSSHCITSDCVDRSIGQWFTSEWSQCSVSCGNGHREREVKCYYNGVEVNGCTDIPRPLSRMVCRGPTCFVTAAQKATVGVCKDLPGQSCRLIRAHQLCRLTVYNRKCCATCSAP